MYIRLQTLDGKKLNAREIYEAGKSKCFVTVERTEDNWVYFQEVDPKTINKNQKHYQINATWENTDYVAGSEFGSHLFNIDKIKVDGMVAFDDHSIVSSTGTKYYAYVAEVTYAEVSVNYDKKMLFGVHAPIVSNAKRNKNKGHVSIFKKGWYTSQELESVPSQFEEDMSDAKRWGAKLKYKVYAPALAK